MATRIVDFHVKGLTAVSFSRYHDTPKKEKESADAYEERTWREKSTYDEKTAEVYISPMAFKFAIAEAARRLALQVPGRGKSTYTKYFVSGVLAADRAYIGVKRDQLKCERVHVHANGQRGSGKRVWRKFPIVDEWSTVVRMYVTDATLPKAIVEQCMSEAGAYIGVGRFRPENGGFLGRFEVTKAVWSE